MKEFNAKIFGSLLGCLVCNQKFLSRSAIIRNSNILCTTYKLTTSQELIEASL